MRSAASPVDLTNSSASESDETSDDDSVKYDTIKLAGRRRTVVPNTSQDSSNSVPPSADLLPLAPSPLHTAVAVNNSAMVSPPPVSSSPPAVSRLSPSPVQGSMSPGAVNLVSPTIKTLGSGTNFFLILFL